MLTHVTYLEVVYFLPNIIATGRLSITYMLSVFILCARSYPTMPAFVPHDTHVCTESDVQGTLIIIAREEYQRSSNTIHASLSINNLLALEHLLDSVGRVLLISPCHDIK